MLDIVADIQQRGITRQAGYTRLAPLISDATHMSPHHAGKLVQHAELTTESVTPTGHITPAELPTVRGALRDGALDPEHVEAIAQTGKKIPTSTALGARELVESTLAETARTMAPHVVREHGKRLLAHLDPDGTEPRDPDPTRSGNPAQPATAPSPRTTAAPRAGSSSPLTNRLSDQGKEFLAQHSPCMTLCKGASPGKIERWVWVGARGGCLYGRQRSPE